MIRTWKLLPNKNEEIELSDVTSLDAITGQLPDGYYSTFRTFDGCTRVLGLKSHLQRLPGVDASFLRRQLFLVLEPYRPDEARVRIVLTMQNDLYVSIEPLKPLHRDVYENGIRAQITELERVNPRVKSTAFIGLSKEQRRHNTQIGVFESLLVKNGKITEGMTSNFFFVQAGILHTAQRGILLGVTRRNVLRVAKKADVKVKFGFLKSNQISVVDETFITSSSRGIVPLVQIDSVVIGDGKPGKITKRLMAAYEDDVLERAERIWRQGT